MPLACAGRVAAGRAAARRGRRPVDRPPVRPLVRAFDRGACWRISRRRGAGAGHRLLRAVLSAGARPAAACWPGAARRWPLTYLSYSVLSIVHQSWGARLGGDAPQRARIVSWREGLSLAGRAAGQRAAVRRWAWASTSAVLALSLALGWWRCAVRRARRPADGRRRRAPMRLALAQPVVPAAAGGVPGQRHRQRDPGHAGAVLHPRPAAGAGLRAAVPGQLLPGRGAVDAAVGARGVALRPGAQLAGRHAAGHRQLRLGRAAWARATCSASPRCAWPAAWRWAPT